jgi:stage V sporulation protein AD
VTGTAPPSAAVATAGAAVVRLGPGRIAFEVAPLFAAAYAVAGPEEARGPLGSTFDETAPDYEWGETSFERAERKFLGRAVTGALARAALDTSAVDAHFGGDLLDQITSHNFVARDVGAPFVGVFSACATLGSALGVAALTVATGAARHALASVASHYYTAERQYRYPTELGVERLPTNQRTATGAAAFLLAAPDGPDGVGPSRRGDGAGDRHAAAGSDPDADTDAGSDAVRVRRVTFGRVCELGVKDPNNMGAAEAPAAVDTLLRHLDGGDGADYDLVLTGDLARIGLGLAKDLARTRGLDLGSRWQDAGVLLYDRDQPVDAGGSGAACCALVLAGHVLPALRSGRLGRCLVVATGALHSKTTYQQGEVIPAVAHAVELEGPAARPRRKEGTR